jgi:cell division protein FtsL
MAVNNNIFKKEIPSQTAGFVWIAAICLIFIELMAYTVIRTESTQTILRISKAQELLADKNSYQKALLIERDRLKADDRITRIARTKLNLSSDTLKQTVYLSGENG